MNEGNSARADYRRKIQQRQTVLFGSIAAVLSVIMILSMLVWSGIVPFPLMREFSKAPDPDRVVTPCIANNSTPTDLPAITANVYNSTTRVGLAGTVSEDLSAKGIAVATADNWESDRRVKESARIVTGPRGINAAYTIAQYFPESVIQYDETINDEVISIVLGEKYGKPSDSDGGVGEVRTIEEVAANNPEGKLTSAKGCVNVSNVGS
ncbi:MAG: LytR C-terminal domain-containing protein [Actinomycetaceae bacterium]|nr:LytR C-terminal domain-containing protein [Actinomycetaceae bacterium]